MDPLLWICQWRSPSAPMKHHQWRRGHHWHHTPRHHITIGWCEKWSWLKMLIFCWAGSISRIFAHHIIRDRAITQSIALLRLLFWDAAVHIVQMFCNCCSYRLQESSELNLRGNWPIEIIPKLLVLYDMKPSLFRARSPLYHKPKIEL